MLIEAALGRSAMLGTLLIVVHGAGLIALWISAVPLPVAVGLGFGVIWSLQHAMCKEALRCSPDAIARLRFNVDDRVEIHLLDGQSEEGRVLPSTTIWPFLVVAHFRIEGRARHRHLVILPDSLDEGTFRRLRVALKYAGTQEPVRESERLGQRD